MTTAISDIAFTPAVKAEQTRRGSRTAYARMAQKGDWSNTVDDRLAAFIAERDSFYFGTASADGQPYIQHRGGRAGFLEVLDRSTLAFADYAGKRRIKIWGRARVVEDDPDLIVRLVGGDPDTSAVRAIVFEIEAWDRNCPQFITPRRTDAEIAELIAPLTARIAELEAENAALGGLAGRD